MLNLDDFYKDGNDPSLPRLDVGAIDWDHADSWLHDDALETIERLCRDGEADVPIYDIGQDGRTGCRRLDLHGSAYFIAEGIFAHAVVQACNDRGLLADAICVRHHRLITFWRRLTRDLKERRKPPLFLLRRGLILFEAEPRIVARAVAGGCVPLRPQQAYRRISRLLSSPAPRRPV